MTTATHAEREKFVAGLVRRVPEAEHFHAAKLMRLAGFYLKAQGDTGKRYKIIRRAVVIIEPWGCSLKATEQSLWLEIEGEDWNTLLPIPPI